jgi:hypothetical protein
MLCFELKVCPAAAKQWCNSAKREPYLVSTPRSLDSAERQGSKAASDKAPQPAAPMHTSNWRPCEVLPRVHRPSGKTGLAGLSKEPSAERGRHAVVPETHPSLLPLPGTHRGPRLLDGPSCTT